LAKWLSEGKLKRKETIVKGGLENSEDTFNYLFRGQNIGRHLPVLSFGITILTTYPRQASARGEEPRRVVQALRSHVEGPLHMHQYKLLLTK
jgi:hypothetical protein